MSCGPPYCLGTSGTGCIPVTKNGPCPSCKCCPPVCYDRIDFEIRCGTKASQLIDPPPGYFCCPNASRFCCGIPGECGTQCDCIPDKPEKQPNYSKCGELPFFDNRYLKYKRIRKDRPPSKDYHDFLGFSSDDYLNMDYYFSLEEEIQALNEVPAPGGTTCGPSVPATPCTNLKCSITTSGCCLACPPKSKYDCTPGTECTLGIGDPRELVFGSGFVIIGDGTVNLNIPDPPCGTICKYINGIKRSSASLKNCDAFSFYVEGHFKSYECCNCCIRTNTTFFRKHNWGAAAFREHNKNIMQKNLAERMKKIKF